MKLVVEFGSSETKKLERESKFSGNFGDVFLEQNMLVFEYQTGEIGGMVYREK
jgi:hypothetical protein